MGVTYKAFDTRLGSYVALKVINTDGIKSEVGRVRFEREAKAAAHLNHPNVASIFHRGSDGGTYFYAMQFIEGETFDAFVKRRGPLPVALALRLILQAAQGLAAASTRGLVHRDIKPANLMLVHQEDGDGDDDELLVKVIDFGLAKYLNKPGETGDISLTGDRIVGTPYYMSPEQIDPVGKEVDARTDIYSLGVTLWHLLCGNPPFRGTEFQVLSQHMNSSLPWEQLTASVPPSVHDLLERMMAKDPADRPANHRELVGLIKQQLRMLAGDAAPGAGQSPLPEVVEQSSDLPLPPADFSMADVLRRRGKLTTGEVLSMLSLLAPLVDAKREQEGQTYDLTPARIFVRFDTPPSAGSDLPAQSLDAWPPSQLEIATAPGSDATAAGHPARSLGALAYELLTGSAPGAPYQPAPGVNLRGNTVLQQVLESTDSFGSAVRFAEAFRLSLAGELHVPETPVQEVATESAGWDSGTRDVPSSGSLLAKPIRQAKQFPTRGMMVFVLLLALAAGGWYTARRSGTMRPDSSPAPEETPSSTLPTASTVQVGNPAEMGPLPPGTIISRAVRRYTPPPYYPPAAKAAHQQGITLLEVDVDAVGSVTGTTVKKSSGYASLDEAAAQSVRAWKFDPARRNDVAVPSRTLQPIEFKPPPPGAPPGPGR